MWVSTSLGRGGAFSELKEQFHSGFKPGCQWRNLADGWAAGEWSWNWRSGKHKGSRMKGGVPWTGTCVTSRTRNDR